MSLVSRRGHIFSLIGRKQISDVKEFHDSHAPRFHGAMCLKPSLIMTLAVTRWSVVHTPNGE